MTRGACFWCLMLLWFVFGIVGPYFHPAPFWVFGGTILEFVLFALLGWSVFGPAIKG